MRVWRTDNDWEGRRKSSAGIRPERVFARLKERATWIKFNMAYTTGAGAGLVAAMAAANIAHRQGVSREVATTFISPVTGFAVGFSTHMAAWRVIESIGLDTEGKNPINGAAIGKMLVNAIRAEIMELFILAPVPWLLSKIDLFSTDSIVIIRRVLGWTVFPVLLNVFSRFQIRRLGQDTESGRLAEKQQTDEGEISTK